MGRHGVGARRAALVAAYVLAAFAVLAGGLFFGWARWGPPYALIGLAWGDTPSAASLLVVDTALAARGGGHRLFVVDPADGRVVVREHIGCTRARGGSMGALLAETEWKGRSGAACAGSAPRARAIDGRTLELTVANPPHLRELAPDGREVRDAPTALAAGAEVALGGTLCSAIELPERNGVVVVQRGEGGRAEVGAIDRGGHLLWTVAVGTPRGALAELAFAQAPFEPVVYVAILDVGGGVAGWGRVRLVAIDEVSGRERWAAVIDR